ncbi:MAG: OHCU decarboxylase, partial [Acidobacteria bacterium]|nr:OHCU decarboxylase [Acidobacteriota bacterium]
MNETLARWNQLPAEEAEQEILACCASPAWAKVMVRHRPITEEATLLSLSDDIWRRLSHSDRMEALRSHPRIGERLRENPRGETRADA